jgi:hypothetical protein
VRIACNLIFLGLLGLMGWIIYYTIRSSTWSIVMLGEYAAVAIPLPQWWRHTRRRFC